jgi:polar amino acid transport system permease protein
MGTFEILSQYRTGLLAGLWVTLQLSLIVWFLGLVGGTALSLLAARFPRVLGIPIRALAFLITSIPVIVILFWAYYPAQILFNLAVSPFATTAIVITALNALGVAEIIRPAIVSFPAGYIATARVAGMTELAIFRSIQMPLVLRQTLPALLGLQVIALQSTIFGSLISVNEIFRVAQQVVAATYRPVQVYTALAVFFLVLCLPLNIVALIARQWLKDHLSVE